MIKSSHEFLTDVLHDIERMQDALDAMYVNVRDRLLTLPPPPDGVVLTQEEKDSLPNPEDD